ncbi:NAD-binding protein [Streptomyces iconiensis]|uniref:NAD-binding protein n=1 Tax=Streptomyces iconiensis TaxID=1384038 RepID=A0ABT7A772_9ACTN|nr:NAD-binding protein [Streptomyces iconiensis]MDJ1137190.1 NAD-binding protein [Streptomyces iconiensis]
MAYSLSGNARRGHMVVCGDNSLAQRLVKELASVYGQRVTVVLPSLRGGDHGPQIAGLVGNRRLRVNAVEAQVPDDEALRRAGIEGASALALTSGDDQLNIHIALRARRINPELRLVIRMFNRTLGGYLESLLDRAARVRTPHLDQSAIDASTTVLSDSDTAAPSLVAAAVVGSDKIVYADGLMLRAKERTLATAARRNPLCTLALLPGSDDADEGDTEEEADTQQRRREGGREGPVLLPDDASLEGLPAQRGAIVLEAITRTPGAPAPPRAPRLPRLFAFKELFSRRLRYSLLALTGVVIGLAAFNWIMSGDSPAHAGYVTLLDVFGINDPKTDEPADEQLLQLLAGFAGMLLLPLFLAIVLESYGAFRKAAALPDPPRGLSGHVVLLGLGKVGARVLEELLEHEIPVVCVERDPEARGVALARKKRVPTLIADVTESGVLQDARLRRARALLALTSSDGTNLEASLYARQLKPEVRVVMRLFDDEFATTVYRTLRDTYPAAQTRSRSVSALAAPAFAGAMMGRQVLGAIPVGRRVLVFAAVDVAGNPLLEGRTVAEAFRAGAWRVLALDLAHHTARPPAEQSLSWQLDPGHPLRAGERVVVAATRRGLGQLLAESPEVGPPPMPGTGEHDVTRALRWRE